MFFFPFNPPRRNQFMPDSDNSIEVFNPGASGLQVVEASVPANQDTNFFKLGGSLLVGEPTTSQSLIQPEIGVYPAGGITLQLLTLSWLFQAHGEWIATARATRGQSKQMNEHLWELMESIFVVHKPIKNKAFMVIRVTEIICPLLILKNWRVFAPC